MNRIIHASLVFALGLALVTACGKQGDTEGAAGAAMTLAKLLEQPDQFTDKEIVLTGTVTHVCKHGGKRLHITDIATNDVIRVESGEDMSAFARELEGSDIVVTGVLRETRIDKAYLDEWEQELLADQAEAMKAAKEEEKDAKTGTTKGKEQTEQAHAENTANEGHVEPQGMDAVIAKREELVASGKPYLSQWHLECRSYSMKDGSTAPVAKDPPAEEGHMH
jgi:hypothetical protein